MKPPAFDYVAAQSIDQVVALLAEHGDEASVIAGGQSLVPMMAYRLARPAILIDLNRVPGLSGIGIEADRVRVGAMTRQSSVLGDPGIAKALPALAAANRMVGHYQTRARGTVGGSVALADPAAENPAFALALDAEIEFVSKTGSRRLPASAFFTGSYTTAIRPDELITALHYPSQSAGLRVAVDEIARRPGDFAMTGMVAAIRLGADGRINYAGLAWFGMSSEPSRAASAERALMGALPAQVDAKEIAQLAIADVEPKDDVQASAAYRSKAGARLAMTVIASAIGGQGQ